MNRFLSLWPALALGAVAAAVCAGMAFYRNGADSADAVPAPAGAGLVERGAYLARAGDCMACHSLPKGQPYAGGLALKTPLGNVYSTNISPDPDTGIGRWTQRDFSRALRRGVSRDGHNLYPAMPYPSYAKLRDEDVAALYAYFMQGVAAVRQDNRAPDFGFPLNLRWPLKLWNLVFLDPVPYRDKPGRDAEWNRGAYLTQGLGHCGSCHTPRGVGFQEKALDEGGAAYLSGAPLDGWFASNLGGDPRTGLGRWSAQSVAAFLRGGANEYASAFGSMTDVINNSTQYLSDADIGAMVVYLKSLPAHGAAPAADIAAASEAMADPAGRRSVAAGARLYGEYCVHCHGVNGRGAAPLLAPLAGNPNVTEARAVSLINVTLNGTPDLVLRGLPAAYPMPAFAQVLSDREVADVLTYVRASWGEGAPPVAAREVAKLRAMAVAHP